MPLAIRMWSFQHLKSWKLAESTPSVQHQGLARPSISMTVMAKFSKQSKALKIGSRSEEFRKFKLLGHTAAIVSTRKETFGEVAVFAGTPCTSFILSELLRQTTNIQQSSKRRIPLPNRMNFWKNSKQPLTPPPHFWKIILQFFIMDMVAFMQGGIGQIGSVNIS